MKYSRLRRKLTLFLFLSLAVLACRTAYADTSSLSIAVSKTVTNYPNALTVSGTLSPAHNGATVILYSKALNSSVYTQIATDTTDIQGKYYFTYRPQAGAYLKVGWAGDGDHDPAESPVKRIYVKPYITIYKNVKNASIHKIFEIYGYVNRKHSSKPIYLQCYKGGRWVTLKQATLNTYSKYKFRIALHNLKTYTMRVVFSDTDHMKHCSKNLKVTCVWPNPWGISSSIPKYVVVVRSVYRLYLVRYGNIVKTFPVAIGRGTNWTPAAYWKIGEKNPRYPGSVQGPLVLRLYRKYGSTYSWTRFGIHGTNQEYLLYTYPRNYSHGCIRMFNADILYLSSQVPIGTKVRTI